MIQIPFHKSAVVGTEIDKLQQALQARHFAGDGPMTKKCSQQLEAHLQVPKVLLTPSCTHSLEMSALLADIQPGDEVIMPSYTFVSTANAFVLRGAIIKFVDIRPDTMNLDERLIEAAITPQTKAIVPVHYAGVGCEMDTMMQLATHYQLWVIEDAAQALYCSYKGRSLGAIGDFGCYSFHETKNYSCGEGGAIAIPHQNAVERAEIIREKGTNRSKFFRGQVDKYTWVDRGSSYLLSEFNAAILSAQLDHREQIMADRMQTWTTYDAALRPLIERGLIDGMHVPAHCIHNAHMYYIKLRNLESRTRLIEYLRSRGIQTAFHYVPLHSSIAGQKYGVMCGEDNYTTRESERLLRLPLYYGISKDDVGQVVEGIEKFLLT